MGAFARIPGDASLDVVVPNLQLTAKEFKPAFVKPFTPVEGPTVWYGKDITAEVSSNHLRCILKLDLSSTGRSL